MPYQVKFSDQANRNPITVYDNVSSTDTSLTFPGRNVTSYGQIIAENFLHLLENFASATEPVNPIEGQLWYNKDQQVLFIWDSNNWKSASNIQRDTVAPTVSSAKSGELWVDTANQQLYIFSGTRWILVGPPESSLDGLRSGPVVESIYDSDNNSRVILIFYIKDVPVIIVSKDNFTPKISISGFTTIYPGFNITTADISGSTFAAKLYGTATSANALIVADKEVAAAKFLRSDAINTLEFGLNVRNNSGVSIGSSSDTALSISNSDVGAQLYNARSDSSIDIQIKKSGIATTVLRVVQDKVGINTLSPDEALDVEGNIRTNGSLILTDTTTASNFSTGTIQSAGGISIAKNALIGNGLTVSGITTTQTLQPAITDTYELGTDPSTGGKRWNNIRSKTVTADTFVGTLDGSITGNSNTANNLKNVTSFTFTGDVTLKTPPVQFDGQVGGTSKIFETRIDPGIIVNKSNPVPNTSIPGDTVLVYRPSVGLIKETRNVFVGDLAVPIGAILPYAGANAPTGYLLCDGSEVEIVKYKDLYDIIGNIYGVPSIGDSNVVFKLPDLRGRFPLGKDNMDNGGTVPDKTNNKNYIDAGGGNVDRVPGTDPDNLGGSGGSDANTLVVSNLPEHDHDMRGTLPNGNKGAQYYAMRLDSAVPVDLYATSEKGPTTVGQAQHLPSSGGVNTSGSLNQPFSIINPFLTLNYIIRSGPPKFTTT